MAVLFVWTARASKSAPHLSQGRSVFGVKPTVHRDFPFGGRVQAQDHPYRPGLARAVRAKETSDYARSYGEAEVIDGRRLAISLS